MGESPRHKMEVKERKAGLRAAVRTLAERAVKAREQERQALQERRRFATRGERRVPRWPRYRAEERRRFATRATKS